MAKIIELYSKKEKFVIGAVFSWLKNHKHQKASLELKLAYLVRVLTQIRVQNMGSFFVNLATTNQQIQSRNQTQNSMGFQKLSEFIERKRMQNRTLAMSRLVRKYLRDKETQKVAEEKEELTKKAKKAAIFAAILQILYSSKVREIF